MIRSTIEVPIHLDILFKQDAKNNNMSASKLLRLCIAQIFLNDEDFKEYQKENNTLLKPLQSYNFWIHNRVLRCIDIHPSFVAGKQETSYSLDEKFMQQMYKRAESEKISHMKWMQFLMAQRVLHPTSYENYRCDHDKTYAKWVDSTLPASRVEHPSYPKWNDFDWTQPTTASLASYGYINLDGLPDELKMRELLASESVV